jgi:isoquinoline 1-oxidoreductase beta subunit
MSGARVFLPRRDFLAGLGLAAGGLVLGAVARAAPAPVARKPEPKSEATADARADLFVHVAPDGTVKIVCHRSEMGQGIRSSVPALIADELGADMARVTIVQADGDKAYGDQNTDGSSSIRGKYDMLRRIGATARTMLVATAAKRWGVAASSCVALDHRVLHTATKRALSFGDLATEAATLPLPKPKDVVLRPKSELRTLGKILPLVDAPDIVTGRALYGADVALPGMLTAMVVRPPVVGGRVAHFDASRALAVPGVRKVVQLPAPTRPFGFKPLGGIAIIADHTWAAMRGRAALEVTWDAGDNGTYDSVTYHQTLSKALDGASKKVVRKTGDAEAALAGAATRVVAEYHTPHLAHAPMEPPVAVAHVRDGAGEIWTSTQNPQASRTEVAKALGLDETKVTVHVTLLGGGFGRKSKPDYVVEAALLSRAANAPVRLQWTREDDVQHDYYHSTSAQRLTAGLDANGKVTSWHHRVAFPSIGSTFAEATFGGEGELQQGVLDLPLAVPNVLAEVCEAHAMTRIGWLRSVANIYHAFAEHSFIDELAAARGVDPKENILELLGPARIVSIEELGIPNLPNYGASLTEHPVDTARHRGVVARVTELARWDARKSEGRALGLAVHRSFLTYVAVVVSVVHDAERQVRVDEAWIVADAGTLVNIERVRSQLEGAVIFGLGHALYGAITMKAGATEQSNFRDYRLMRIGQAPRAVHVDVIPSNGPPCGIGEPGVPPVAPALANAVFALTGTRVRTLPIASAVRVA